MQVVYLVGLHNLLVRDTVWKNVSWSDVMQGVHNLLSSSLSQLTGPDPLNPAAIPFFRPELGEDEIAEVTDALRSGWLTTGPKTRRFEQAFAEAVGAKHAVALNSATAALHLALEAVGVGPGDEVLVPTMTFAATAEVVLHLGAKPVLVDCLSDSLNVDPEALAATVTPRTRAVMPMHYGGQPCQMDAILKLAKTHDLRVVEDAAHAFPASYAGERIGSIGDASCFSFYANKTITTGEGGMLTTNNSDLADRARMMSLHGLSKDAWNRFSAGGSWSYQIMQAGFKCNMTDLAAAIGIHQLRRADDFRDRRERCAAWYREALADVPQVELLHTAANVQHSWHLLVIQLRLEQLKIDRNRFIELLTAEGIGTSVHWQPLHMHPYYHETCGYQPQDFPVAAAAFERVVSLPIFPGMKESEVQRVADVIRQIVTEQGLG